MKLHFQDSPMNFARYINSRIRDEGYVALGVPGGMTLLHIAMMISSSKIVSLLLKHGADVHATNVMGQDPFQNASTFGRSDNLKFWLEQFPSWDIDRPTSIYGGTALSIAVFMGFTNREAIEFLIGKGANTTRKTSTGSSIIVTAASNEDADLGMVKMLLQIVCGGGPSRKSRNILNQPLRPVSSRWRATYAASKILVRTGLTNAALYRILADEPGTTALSYAVMRGDDDLTKLLLKYGADPRIKNDMGLNALDLCNKYGPYPNVLKTLSEYSLA